MGLMEKLTSPPDPENWNHPRLARHLPPVCAGLGAVAGDVVARHVGAHPPMGAGIGAGVAVLVAFPVLAALD